MSDPWPDSISAGFRSLDTVYYYMGKDTVTLQSVVSPCHFWGAFPFKFSFAVELRSERQAAKIC